MQCYSPGKHKPGLILRKVARGQVSIRQDRGATFREDERQHVSRFAGTVQAEAVFLRPMNCQQALQDLGPPGTGVVLLDHLDEPPDGALAFIGRGRSLPGQPPAEAGAETELVPGRNGCVVQVVVGVGIEHAVGEDGRRQAHPPAQQHLQAASGPGVAAGLQDVGGAHPRIETPGLARQAGPDGRKPAGQQHLQVPILQPQGRPPELGEGGGDPLVSGRAFRPRARQSLQLSLHPAEEPLELAFRGGLLGGRKSAAKNRQAGRAVPPKRDRLLQ